MAKKTKKLHPGGFAQNDFMSAVRRQQRGQKQNPMMPTAGMSQGRAATGRTPMPGPAPDPERMKRFQKLMREARERGLKAQSPPKAKRPHLKKLPPGVRVIRGNEGRQLVYKALKSQGKP